MQAFASVTGAPLVSLAGARLAKHRLEKIRRDDAYHFCTNMIDQKVYTISLVVYNADCWKHSCAGMAFFIFSMNRTGALERSKTKILTDDMKIQYFKGAENI